MEYLLIGLGGFLGANARYLVSGWIAHRWGVIFPWGTFVANISGSLLLGFLMGFLQQHPTVSPNSRFFFAIGFLGAYTTFSTFSYETVRLAQDQGSMPAILNIVGSVSLGLVGVLLGFILARLFSE